MTKFRHLRACGGWSLRSRTPAGLLAFVNPLEEEEEEEEDEAWESLEEGEVAEAEYLEYSRRLESCRV